MMIFARACAEFHDRNGAVLFTIRPINLLQTGLEAPDSIRQDPLFDMLVRDGLLSVTENKEDLKRLENNPDADTSTKTGKKKESPGADTGSEAPEKTAPEKNPDSEVTAAAEVTAEKTASRKTAKASV